MVHALGTSALGSASAGTPWWCGTDVHARADIVLHKTTTGCTFTPGGSSGGTGVTLQQLASTLSTDVGTLQRLNGDRNLTGSSVVTGRISIPCAPSP